MPEHEPSGADEIIAVIDRGFERTPHPGAAFLQGSHDGCEPAEAVRPFRDVTDWRAVEPAWLDTHYDALSFLSEGGFRFFLPAWLVADLRGQLQTAEPLFHLTAGFTVTNVTTAVDGRRFERRRGGTTLLNPRRYGAMTFEDAARHRLSVFCRDEVLAIVAYLELCRATADLDMTREAIDAALAAFWHPRCASAPGVDALDAHVVAELEYVRALTGRSGDLP